MRARQTDPIGLRLIPTVDVSFEDVRVPGSALPGGAGDGLKTFLSTFSTSRLGDASERIGFGRRALAQAARYASRREVGDHLVADFPRDSMDMADAHGGL